MILFNIREKRVDILSVFVVVVVEFDENSIIIIITCAIYLVGDKLFTMKEGIASNRMISVNRI